MTPTLPETHPNLDRIINGTQWCTEKKQVVQTQFTFTDLEKQVMNLFSINCYVKGLYSDTDPAYTLLDWEDVQPLKELLGLTTNQLKGIVGSLAKKSAIEIEVRGDTPAEKAIWGQDLYWISKECFDSIADEKEEVA